MVDPTLLGLPPVIRISGSRTSRWPSLHDCLRQFFVYSIHPLGFFNVTLAPGGQSRHASYAIRRQSLEGSHVRAWRENCNRDTRRKIGGNVKTSHVAVTTGRISVVLLSTDRPVITETWLGASVRPIRHGWQRRYRWRMKSILLSMDVVVVVVSTMVMITPLLTLRDGECTIPQQTCKRSF